MFGPTIVGGAVGKDGSSGPAGPAGRGVTHTDVLNGDLHVTFTDGTTLNAGHVVGEVGSEGKPGRGIVATEVVNGHLMLTFTDNTTATLGSIVGPQGVAGRGIQSSVVQGGRLVITYTDGTTSDTGYVVGAKGDQGRGVSATAITGGRLIIYYTDGTNEDKGVVVGGTGATGQNGATGASPWGAVAPWAANTNYTSVAPASIVTNDDGSGMQTYVAKAGVGAFTSGATFNASNWTLIAGHATANASVTVRTLLGMARLTDSGTWTKAAADAAYPGWTHVKVVPISGGNSGFTVSTSDLAWGCHGGNGGAVASRILSRSELASSVPWTTGVGGGIQGTDAYRRSSGGTGSGFGAYVRSAPGQTVYGVGGTGGRAGVDMALLQTTSIYAMALPGTTIVHTYQAAGAGYPTPTALSLGPGSGGGGAGGNSANPIFAGGAGGVGDYGGAQTPGGVPSLSAPAKGADGAVGSFGGGGAGGAGGNTAPFIVDGGKGGFPGGGGGGASTGYTNTTVRSQPGAGGDGCVDLFYYKDSA